MKKIFVVLMIVAVLLMLVMLLSPSGVEAKKIKETPTPSGYPYPEPIDYGYPEPGYPIQPIAPCFIDPYLPECAYPSMGDTQDQILVIQEPIKPQYRNDRNLWEQIVFIWGELLELIK